MNKLFKGSGTEKAQLRKATGAMRTKIHRTKFDEYRKHIIEGKIIPSHRRGPSRKRRPQCRTLVVVCNELV